MVRLREFPASISRLEAAYAFFSLSDAQEFGENRSCLVYEVEIERPDAQTSNHPFELVAMPTAGASVIPSLEIMARKYWNAAPMAKPEILTLSPLRIIKRVP
jgi:hypothetical protein